MSAAKCIWCGQTYEEHRDEPLPSGATPRVPCLGLKTGFTYGQRIAEAEDALKSARKPGSPA